MTPQTGQDLLNFVTSILGGQSPSPSYILQLINIERQIIENMKPWKVLIALNNEVTIDGTNTWQTPIPLPKKNSSTGEDVDFVRWMNEGSVLLFNGNLDVEDITEVPYEALLDYQFQYGRYAVDYGAGNMYFTGIIPSTYQVYMYFIADYGDIQLTTTWKHFPSRFAKILAFRAAARWRLGTSYDDVAARNADDNYKAGQALYEAMDNWDTELNIASYNAVDYKNDRYPGIVGGAGNGSNFNWWGQRWGPM